jgi:predicted hotdog family 3-hydroxylacyl-ACP dehydratase
MIPAVEQLIPHRPPMQLLERVLRWEGDRVQAEVLVAADDTFLDQNKVSAVVGLEYLAQAAAAFFTLAASDHNPPRPGMLIACPSFTCAVDTFDLDARLLITVHLASRLPTAREHNALVKFRGEIHALQNPGQSGNPSAATAIGPALVSAELSVYL